LEKEKIKFVKEMEKEKNKLLVKTLEEKQKIENEKEEEC
jgi:hypothetical protein